MLFIYININITDILSHKQKFKDCIEKNINYKYFSFCRIVNDNLNVRQADRHTDFCSKNNL